MWICNDEKCKKSAISLSKIENFVKLHIRKYGGGDKTKIPSPCGKGTSAFFALIHEFDPIEFL